MKEIGMNLLKNLMVIYLKQLKIFIIQNYKERLLKAK